MAADRPGSGRRYVAFVGISVCGFRETRARKSTSPACHPETMPRFDSGGHMYLVPLQLFQTLGNLIDLRS
jgi:hypothetical protein